MYDGHVKKRKMKILNGVILPNSKYYEQIKTDSCILFRWFLEWFVSGSLFFIFEMEDGNQNKKQQQPKIWNKTITWTATNYNRWKNVN